MPECRRIVEFVDNEADNFLLVRAADWGFFGLPVEYSEEIIEDVPGEYQRIRRVYRTEVGEFHAVTRHLYPHLDSSDYRWERRYITTFDEMVRLAEAPRTTCTLLLQEYEEDVESVGNRGMPIVGLMHPLGLLVRNADMQEVYGWLLTEPSVMRHFLESTNTHVRDTVLALGKAGLAPWFGTCAHEMLIPPWMGMRHFDEWVFPYDKLVNDAVHAIGGRCRSHCHGECMDFLERMSEMGVDAVEPLEPPPFGNVNLREAKRQVGDRMVLSGNIPSQEFCRVRPDKVRQWVKDAVAVAAAGGGFALRTTGGHSGVNVDLDRSQLLKIIDNVEAYINAALEFGKYPIAE